MDSKAVYIGDIDFGDENFIEEDGVMVPSKDRLNPPGIGLCKVYVYAAEGEIPHFHIVSKDESSFLTCVKILEADYFLHGRYVNIFNSVQRKILDNWLSSKLGNNSIWEHIKYIWEQLTKTKLPKIDKPNYRDLPSRAKPASYGIYPNRDSLI